jgi:hypothetical protein
LACSSWTTGKRRWHPLMLRQRHDQSILSEPRTLPRRASLSNSLACGRRCHGHHDQVVPMRSRQTSPLQSHPRP